MDYYWQVNIAFSRWDIATQILISVVCYLMLILVLELNIFPTIKNSNIVKDMNDADFIQSLLFSLAPSKIIQGLPLLAWLLITDEANTLHAHSVSADAESGLKNRLMDFASNSGFTVLSLSQRLLFIFLNFFYKKEITWRQFSMFSSCSLLCYVQYSMPQEKVFFKEPLNLFCSTTRLWYFDNQSREIHITFYLKRDMTTRLSMKNQGKGHRISSTFVFDEASW